MGFARFQEQGQGSRHHDGKRHPAPPNESCKAVKITSSKLVCVLMGGVRMSEVAVVMWVLDFACYLTCLVCDAEQVKTDHSKC